LPGPGLKRSQKVTFAQCVGTDMLNVFPHLCDLLHFQVQYCQKSKDHKTKMGVKPLNIPFVITVLAIMLPGKFIPLCIGRYYMAVSSRLS
jgi:hypothetical protein